MAGVISAMKFVASSSVGFSNFVDYLDREEAIDNSSVWSFDDYSDYMNNSEKTKGLFNQNGFLSKNEKRDIHNTFSKSQEKGSCLYQQVFSFEPEWLKKHGIVDLENGIVNDEKMINVTKLAMTKELDSENFKSAEWIGAIHYNTQHLHIHIAIVDKNVSWKENTGRCKKNKNGELYQRGKFKQKSINVAKSIFANEIMNTKELNSAITSALREKAKIVKNDEFDFFENPLVAKKYLQLLNRLPSDKRLWKYNNNAMKNYRNDIDEITDTILNSFFFEDMQEFDALVETAKNNYIEAFGETPRNFKNEKYKDLYSRLGNAVLQNAKEYSRMKKNENVKNGTMFKNDKSFVFSRNRKYSIMLSSSLSQLNRAFHKDLQSLKNQLRYQELENELVHEMYDM